MKYLLLISFVFFFSCAKQKDDFAKSNKFEVSFISYGNADIAKYTLFASADGRNFIPVKEIIPSTVKDIQYKVQFAIPQEKLNADGKVLFYMEETASSGFVSKTEIVSVE